MGKLRKTYYLLSFVLLGAIGAFCFGKKICWAGLEYYVHKIDPKAHLEAQDIRLGSKGLQLEKVLLDGTFGHIEIGQLQIGLKVFLRRATCLPSIKIAQGRFEIPEKPSSQVAGSGALRLHLEIADSQLIRGEHALSVAFTSGQTKEDLGLLELQDGKAQVMFKQLPEGLSAICRFQHADLKELAPFGDLFPTSWIPEEGFIAGHLTFGWNHEGGFSDFGGDLSASDLELWHPKRKLQFGAKNLQWKGDFPTGTLKMDDGYLLALSKRLPAQWGLRLSGGVEKGKIALKGCMVREGEVFPIEIAGDGKIGKESALQTALHISGEGSSTIAVNLKPSQSIIRGIFSDVSSKQLLLFRDGLGAFFPIFRDLQLEGSKLNAELTAFLKGGQLLAVEADKITAEGMSLNWPSQQIEGQGKNLKLTGTLPFKEGPKWKEAIWNFAIDQGKILDFEDVAVQLCVQGEKVQLGKASSRWQGFQIEGEAKGALFHPEISLNAWGTTAKLASVLKTDTKDDQPLSLRALIDRKDAKFNCVGNLKAGDGQITFGSAFHLKKEIPQGWVEGENISSALYQLIIDAMGLEFEVEGLCDFSGTFNSSGAELAISSKLLRYTSDEIDIDIPHLDKHSRILTPPMQNACLSYRAKGRHWELSVPLFGATLKDKTYGFTASGLEGLVIFDGRRLFAQDLKAKIHDLDVSLHLSLDMKAKGLADLHLCATEIEGDIQGLIDVLHHFEKFKTLELPVTGRVHNLDQNPFSLHAPLGQSEKASAYSAHLKLVNGTYAVTDAFLGKNLACELKFSSDDEILEINALDGDAELISNGEHFDFEVNAPHLRLLDMDQGDWEFDLRIESQTHDLMRFSGAFDHEKGLALDETQSHLFGGKLHLDKMHLHPLNLKGHSELKLQKVVTGLRFLDALDLFKVDPKTLTAIEKSELHGNLLVDVEYSANAFNIELGGKDLKIKQKIIPQFALKIDLEDRLLALDRFVIGNFEARGLAEKTNDVWNLSLFEIDWGQTQLQTFEGQLSDNLFTLILNSARLDLRQLSPLFLEQENTYFQGLFDVTGNLTFDISNFDFNGQFQFASEDFTAAKIDLKTLAPFEIDFKLAEGLSVTGALLELAKSEVQIEKLGYDREEKHWTCEDLKLSFTPEMVHFFAEKRLIPFVETQNDELMIRGIPFAWDNHLETTLDFSYGPKSFTLSAQLKEGFYWIGDVSCYLKDGVFSGRNTGVTFQAKSRLNAADFSILAELPFDPAQDPRIVLNDYSELTQKPLTISFSRDSKAFIKHAVGSFCGFDLDFHHNASLPNHRHLGLTGEASIDWSQAAKILPDHLSEPIQDYDIGRGYKITGDLLLDVIAPAKSTFKGFFKGKNFELLGYKFKSMLSQVDYSADYLLLQDFSLADKALALQVPHLNIANQMISVPSLKIQDLRPSLLQKCGKLPGRLKPFVIKQLEFHKISGKLGDRKSFTGKGHLQFINTFKRDVGLLDIPKELFSRIGLDTGLLIPVRGELDCELDGARVHFLKLADTFSDGERSEFFLSKKTPSYIDLDGQIHIDIRMKQYVLLRVTEPFVLSIRGTLDHPKFSLQ